MRVESGEWRVESGEWRVGSLSLTIMRFRKVAQIEIGILFSIIRI